MRTDPRGSNDCYGALWYEPGSSDPDEDPPRCWDRDAPRHRGFRPSRSIRPSQHGSSLRYPSHRYPSHRIPSRRIPNRCIPNLPILARNANCSILPSPKKDPRDRSMDCSNTKNNSNAHPNSNRAHSNQFLDRYPIPIPRNWAGTSPVKTTHPNSRPDNPAGRPGDNPKHSCFPPHPHRAGSDPPPLRNVPPRGAVPDPIPKRALCRPQNHPKPGKRRHRNDRYAPTPR